MYRLIRGIHYYTDPDSKLTTITNFEGHFRKFRQLIISYWTANWWHRWQGRMYLDGTEYYVYLHKDCPSSFRLCRCVQFSICATVVRCQLDSDQRKSRHFFSSGNMASFPAGPWIMSTERQDPEKGHFYLDKKKFPTLPGLGFERFLDVWQYCIALQKRCFEVDIFSIFLVWILGPRPT